MDMPDGFVLAAISAREDRARCVRVQRATTRCRRCRPAPSSARRACAARRSCASAYPHARDRTVARQRAHAAAQARRRPVRRDHPRGGRAEAPGPRHAHPLRCSIRTKACRRRARARSRSNAAPIAPISWPRSRRSPIGRRRSRRRPSERFRAHWAAVATRRSPRTPNGRRTGCGCAACSPRATVATCCAANARARSSTSTARAGARRCACRRIPGARRGAASHALPHERTGQHATQAHVAMTADVDSLRRAARGPLEGVGIVVTRPQRQAAVLAAKIGVARRRADHLAGDRDPAAAGSRRRSSARMRRSRDYDIAVFVSANAVEFGAPAPNRWPAHIVTYAPGPGTAETLAAAGIPDARVPVTSLDSEGLLELPALADVTRQANRDFPRRRRPRISGQYVAVARRHRGSRAVLPARCTAIGCGRPCRSDARRPGARGDPHVERRARQPDRRTRSGRLRAPVAAAGIRRSSAHCRARARARIARR